MTQTIKQDDNLVNELIQTLEGQNKTKIHEIYLITQQLNSLALINKQLVQKQAALTIFNTQQTITSETQRIDILRLENIIKGLEQIINDRENHIMFQESLIIQLKNKNNQIVRIYQPQREESVYNLLMTNYFEQPVQKPNDHNQTRVHEEHQINLKQTIIQNQSIIEQLENEVNALKQSFILLKQQSQQQLQQAISNATKWQIQFQQVSVKNKHLEETVKLAEERNNELGRNVKQLVQIRYALQIRINTISSSQQQQSSQIQYYRKRNEQISLQVMSLKQRSMKDNMQIQSFNQAISDLQAHLTKVKEENQIVLLEHERLKKQLNNILMTKVDIEQLRSLEKQHEALTIDMQLLKNQLHLKNVQVQEKEQKLQEIKGYCNSLNEKKEQTFNLVNVNRKLNSEINVLRQRLFEEEQRNRQAMRLERANRSLMRRVELLETSMYDKRKSSTKIDSLLNLPSIVSIPSMERIGGQIKSRPDLMRIKSEQNLGKAWSREEYKGSSRVKEIFSSRKNPVNDKAKWKNLEERIQSIKFQNEDLKKHLSLHKL